MIVYAVIDTKIWRRNDGINALPDGPGGRMPPLQTRYTRYRRGGILLPIFNLNNRESQIQPENAP
jgi:hypothetical protein